MDPAIFKISAYPAMCEIKRQSIKENFFKPASNTRLPRPRRSSDRLVLRSNGMRRARVRVCVTDNAVSALIVWGPRTAVCNMTFPHSLL